MGGGWFSSGYNLTTGKRSEWGSYKPDTPRWDSTRGRYRKYEHPAGVPTEPYIPAIPIAIADQWLGQYDGWQNFKENYQGDEEFTAWAFVLSDPEIPINITEGNKKTNSLVTHYGLTIGLVGVWNWINPNAPRHYNPNGTNYREKIITPLLTPLLCDGREVNIWFDEDEKRKSRKAVESATIALGKALEEHGCEVNVACWNPEDGKGIDDAIAAHGAEFLNQITWYSLEKYPHRYLIETQKKLNSLTYPVDLQLDAPRLPDLVEVIPDSGIINLKSAKGTGKSWQIKELIKKWEAQRKYVISITPRIALGRGQAVEWGISWIDDVGRIQTASIGVCWDSLRKLLHLDWSNAVVIIDESELGIEHLLSSSTCKDKRPELLKIFQEKIPECLNGGGTVFLADADLTNVSVDYISAIAPNAPIYTIVNEALPKQWRVAFQSGKIDETLEQLFFDIENGVKVAITTDSQAEAEALEREIKLRFPSKKVDRVDGKTCQEDYGKAWVKRPNESIEENQPDVLIYTPSMGVGVSITVDYFETVYGLFHGVLAPKDCRQMLARVRTPIPRIIWCAQKGMIPDDESSFTPEAIKKNIGFNAKEELSLLDVIGAIAPEADDAESLYQVLSDIRNDGKWDNVHLDTYAKLKARRNYGLNQLAVQLRQELIEEGHDLVDLASLDSTGLGDSLKDGKQLLKEEEAAAIANAQDISIEEAQDMSYQSSLKEEERHQMQKAFIREELPDADLTPDFVLKAIVEDKRRWLNATKLFWFLNNPEIANYLDQRNWMHKLKQFGEGVPFLADVRSYSGKIKLLQDIQLLELLDPDNPNKTFTNDDEEVQAFYKRCWQERDRALRIFGISINKNLTAMQLIGMLSKRVGLVITGKQIREGETRKRIYWINQEELVTPHRIEVLNALDRKGETIAQKADTARTEACHTPTYFVNKIGRAVTDRSHAQEFSEMMNYQEIALEDRLKMLWSAVSKGSERFTQWLKWFVTDPEIAEELA